MREAKPLALLLAALFVLTVAAPVEARPRPAGRHKSNFEANKTFGLGFMIGSPSGLSGKYWVGRDTAIDFGIGYIGCCYHHRAGVNLHADFLWHPISLVSAPAFELPFYLGVGGHFWDFNDNTYADGQALGVRVPFGLAFDFNNVPIDIFVEIAFIFDTVFNYDCNGCNHMNGDVNGAAGLRYYFN